MCQPPTLRPHPGAAGEACPRRRTARQNGVHRHSRDGPPPAFSHAPGAAHRRGDGADDAHRHARAPGAARRHGDEVDDGRRHARAAGAVRRRGGGADGAHRHVRAAGAPAARRQSAMRAGHRRTGPACARRSAGHGPHHGPRPGGWTDALCRTRGHHPRTDGNRRARPRPARRVEAVPGPRLALPRGRAPAAPQGAHRLAGVDAPRRRADAACRRRSAPRRACRAAGAIPCRAVHRPAAGVRLYRVS